MHHVSEVCLGTLRSFEDSGPQFKLPQLSHKEWDRFDASLAHAKYQNGKIQLASKQGSLLSGGDIYFPGCGFLGSSHLFQGAITTFTRSMALQLAEKGECRQSVTSSCVKSKRATPYCSTAATPRRFATLLSNWFKLQKLC